MSYQTQLQEAVKTSLKAGEKDKLIVLRGVLAAIKQREIDERITLNDADILAILDKQIKQRQDAISQFAAAGRDDLVNKEKSEIDVINEFMPQPLSQAEVDVAVATAMQTVRESGEQGMAAMGKVMAILKPQLQGRADIKLVSQQIKDQLQ